MSVSRWVAVDDADSSIQYTGSGWFQDQGSQNAAGNFGPSYRSTLHGTQTNASLSFAFSGTQVKVLGFNNLRNDSGVYDPSWECFIDNISIGKSAPSIAVDNYWVFCEYHQLVDAPHVITVNATVMNAQTFWFDQIQYLPSSSVSLDNAAVIVDNLDPVMQFGDGWGDLGGFCSSTSVPNATFTFPFNGVSLSWYSFIPPQLPHGLATGSYSVDGQPAVNFLLKGLPADSHVSEYNQKVFETSQYDPGPHKIVVTFLGNSSTTPLTLDYLIVQNGTNTSTSSKPTSIGGSSGGSTGTSHSKHIGPIIGGVIGCLVLIGLAIVGYFYFRRWDRKQKEKHFGEKESQFDIAEDNTIEPFHLGPSAQFGSSSTFYPNLPQQGGHGAGYSVQHGSSPSQTTAELKSIIPPSSTSSSRSPAPASDSSQVRQSPSTRTNEGLLPGARSESEPLRPSNDAPYIAPDQQPVVSEKAIQEAEATAAVLRPQRLPLPQEPITPPHSPGSGSSLRIVHEDSGLRLPCPASDGNVVEVPPRYTAG